MLRNGTCQYNLPVDYHNIQQMAVAGDMMEDFVVIFRDMMGRVGALDCSSSLYKRIKSRLGMCPFHYCY